MIKNKHSQEASTMVWIIATVIIIFIVFIFLVLTLFMSETDKIKKMFQSGDNIEIEKSVKQDIALVESIYGVLNTKVDFNGKEVKVGDMIEESLNPYIEFKLQLNKNQANSFGDILEITATDEYFGGDINKFDLNKVPQEIRQSVIKNAIENDKKMFGVIDNILSPICSDYMFKIPQGVIRKGNSEFILELDTANAIGSEKLRYEWTPWTSVDLFYKGKVVEIKYRRLIEC